MILLIQALILTLIFCFIRPYNKGLFATRRWLAKIRQPLGSVDSEEANLRLLEKDAKILSVDLVLKPTINSIFFIAAIIMGFIYRWWGGFLVIAISLALRKVAVLFLTPSLAYFLKRNRKNVLRKIGNLKANEIDDLDEYKQYLADLDKILLVYKDSRLKPPDADTLRDIPCGDINYFKDNYILEK